MARRDGRGGNIKPDDIRQYYTHRRSLTPPEEAHRGRGLANDVIKWARISHHFAKQREARRKGLIAKPDSVLAEAKSMRAKSYAMLTQLENNMSDAMDKFREESALAKKHKADERRHNYHKDRAAHFKSHVKNYQKHHMNAYNAHTSGDYHRAMAEGGYSANSKPHLKNIPSPHY